MPKSQDPGAPAPHRESDSVPLTPAERAREIIEQQLARKQHGGPPGQNGGKPGGVHKPDKGGWSPAPIRPGGRGRRG